MVETSKLVNDLINEYGTNDPFILADKLGIWVYKCPLGKINGHYIYAKRKKVFFINEDLTFIGSVITCAHELGHALLHSKASAYFSYKNNFENISLIEIECNRFAAQLLIKENSRYKNMISPDFSLSITRGFPKEIK